MKNLYIFTLEKIEKRYTIQWYHYFKHEFSKKFNVIYIDGDYDGDTIKTGRFLDINLTNMYKSQQVEQVSKLFAANKIKNDDIFFFMDFWHFGITAVKYMIQLNDLKCKIYGYAHAGTYDQWDFISQANLNYWASHNELAWIKALDCVFVATNFHKNLILDYFEDHIKSKEICVVGFPMDWEKEIKTRVSIPSIKDNIIVFPHRINKEKQPQIFDRLSKIFDNYQFIKTMEVTENKVDYYQLMSISKICFSSSLQETYGIGTVEGLFLGCIPLVPNRLSYCEMYNRLFRYNNFGEARRKLKYFMESGFNKKIQRALKENKEKLIKLSLDAIPKMSEVMLK